MSTLGTPNATFLQGTYGKNQLFTEIVFYEIRGRLLSFFGSLGGRVSGFLRLENNLKIRSIFGVQTDLE